MKSKMMGSIFLLLATIIWGSAFVSQNMAMEFMGPFSFQAIRCWLAVVGLVAVIFLFDRFQKDSIPFIKKWQNKKLWEAGILCGIPLFLACNLQQLALVDTGAGKSGFLTAMYIIFVPIIGIFKKQKPTIMIPISVALAVVGLYFLCCTDTISLAPSDLLLLGCALMFAVQITFVDMFADGLDILRLNTIQALVCAILSTLIALFREQISWQGVMGCALQLAHVGFLSMGAAYAFQLMGQKHLPPTPAALIMSLEALFSVIFEILIQHRFLSREETIGCILMFIAVILSQIPIKKKCKQLS